MASIIIAPETQNFNARFVGNTCTLRIYVSDSFYSLEGEQVTGAQVNGQYFYQEYDCPITNGLIEVPEVTLPSTTDGYPGNATYTAVFYDASGAKQNVKLSNFFLDPELLTANDDSVIESSVTITAAGTGAAQGSYTYSGQNNLKGYWNLEGQSVSTSNYAIVWTGSQWEITSYAGAAYYYSTEDVAYPWEVETWTVYASVLVAGAGTTSANATYTERGTYNNRTYYNQVGQPDDAFTLSIYWSGTNWEITDSLSSNLYDGDTDTTYPWDTTYSQNNGNLPAPTLTFVGGSAPLPAVTQAATIIGTTWQAVFLTNNTPCVPWGTTVDQIYLWITNYLQSVVIPWASTVVGGKIYTSKAPLQSNHPIAVESSEYMWQAVNDNRSLKEWNGDLVQAITDIGATPTTLWITEANQYIASGALLTGGSLTVGETYEIATYTGAVSRGGSFPPVSIVEQGSGYSVGAGQTTTGGTGTGLTVEITFVDGDGLVYGVLPTDAGTGYTVGDIVSIDGAPAILKNAGSAINGTYTQRGTSNSKPYYNLVGYANSTSNRAIVWTGALWKITNSAGTILYSSAETVAYPWLVVTWAVVSGTSPAPEVTDNLCKFKVTSVVEADFSNVGASFFDTDANLCPGNAQGTIFTATGTTPTSWTGASLRPYVTVPNNIKLMFTGEGSIKATTGLGIYVNGMQDPGNVQIFNTDGTSKIIVNPACVPEVNLAWWAETPSDTDDTHEFVQVRDSLAKDKVGGIGYIPAGMWYTDEIIWTSQSLIKGVGAHVDGIGVGTCIAVADNDAKYCGVFAVQQQFVNIAFENLSLIASGVNFCHADTGTVSAFNYTAQGSSSIGLRFTNVNFFSNYQFQEDQQTEISNAGTATLNGIYTQRGMENNRFYYNLVGQGDSTTVSAIVWTTGYQWVITNGAGTVMYSSDDNAIYPWEVTTWVAVGGASPVPVVTNPLGATEPLTKFDGTSQWYEMIDLYFDYCSWTVPANTTGIYWRTTNSGGQFNTPCFRAGQNAIVFDSPASGFITIIDPDCRGNPGYTVSEVPNRTITGADITIGTNILTIPEDYVTPGAMFTTEDIGQYVIIPGALPDPGNWTDPKYYIIRLNSSFEAVLNDNAVGTATGDDLEIQYLGNWTGGVAECIYNLSTNLVFNVYGGADEGFQYFFKLRGAQYFETVNLYGVFLQSILQGTPYSGLTNLYGCTLYSNNIDGLGGAWGVRMMGGVVRRKLIRHDATRFPYPDTMEVSPGNAWHRQENDDNFMFDTSFKEANALTPTDSEELNFISNVPSRFLDQGAFGGPGIDVPQVAIMSALNNDTTKILLRLGQSFPYAGTGRNYYDFARDGITGHLLITGSQAYPYNGVDINGSLMADQSITLNSDSSAYAYGYSHGGTVVQATNKTTAVTINAKCGFIEVNATGTIAANDSVRFKVNNSAVQIWDMPQIIVQHNLGGGIIAVAEDVDEGFFYIRLVNYTAVAETVGYVLRFTLNMRSNPFS